MLFRSVDLLKGIGKLIGLKAVDVPGATGYYDTDYDAKARYAVESLKKDDFVFYLPGPLQKIKDPLFPIESMKKLHETYPQVKFVVSGTPVEKSIVNRLTTLSKKFECIIYAKNIPRKNMYAAYRDSDVVLNCAKSEGMPTAILESMQLGKAVLAHKIESTEAIIQHGSNGLLYKNESKFYQLTERLLTSKRLKSRLEKNAYETYRFYYSNKQETQRILGVYEKAVEVHKRRG